MKTMVATVWAYPDRPLQDSPLQQSCDRWQVPLTVFQQGGVWTNSYQNKLVQLLEEVQALDFDVLVWVDADDAFVTGDPRPGVLAALAHYDAQFLVGAEVVLWPWGNRLGHLFPKVARCNHPNAGVWAATKDALLREFRGMIRFAENDAEGYEEGGRSLRNEDQALFQAWMTSGQSAMTLDTQEQLVLNLHALGVSEHGLFLDLLNARLPPIVHGPGATKDLARRLWAKCRRLHHLVDEPRYDHGDASSALWRRINSATGLLDMLRELPPLHVAAEIGCFKGVSTEVLAHCTQQLLAIDPWPDEPIWSRFQHRLGAYRHVHPLRMTSLEAARVVADQTLDLVYIDADHSYESVRQDIAAWLPKLRPGGFLTGHDYVKEDPMLCGVVAAVNERFGKPDRIYIDGSWLVQV